MLPRQEEAEDGLSRDLENFMAKKKDMDVDEYYEQLEKLLVPLAEINAAVIDKGSRRK